MPIDHGYAVTSANQAHTFGNVSAFITNYVQNLFTPQYFKTTNITSTIAYRYVNLMRVKKQDFLYQKKPMLIIRPRLDFNDSDMFLSGTLLTTRITDNFSDRDYGNLQLMLQDQAKKVDVRFLMNRVKMYFDITIVVEKPMEQMNLVMYLKNRIRQNLPFIIDTPLETNLPRDIVAGYAKLHDLDIENPEHTTRILALLNQNSMYPVTYKLKNSTGNHEFFMYYKNRIDTIISDLAIDDGSRSGFRDNAYAISCTFALEFTTPALFFVFTTHSDLLAGVKESFGEDSDRVVPIFTLDIGEVLPPTGFTTLTNPAFKVARRSVPEVLPLRQIIPDTVMGTLDAFTKTGIAMSHLLQIVIYRDGDRLPETDYTTDWSAMTTTVHSNLNTTSTYRLFVFLNSQFINERASDYYELAEET